MNLSIYFGEKEWERLKESAESAGMTPGKYVHMLVRKELQQTPNTPSPDSSSGDDVVQRRFKLTQTESEYLDHLASRFGTTPGLYLRRLISHAEKNEYYVYTEDLTTLMDAYTRMSDAVTRQTRLLLRSGAISQDGKFLQEQLQELNKQVLAIYDDVVRFRTKTLKRMREEQYHADS